MQNSFDLNQDFVLELENAPGELSDEESFRQLVGALVAMRPEAEKRNSLRFPTPGALSGRIGSCGFDGELISHRVPGPPLSGNNGEQSGGGDRYGVHVVDFSETGVQLQFQCDNPLRLHQSQLCLEMQDAQIPVVPRWLKGSQVYHRGGFLFKEKIGSNLGLVRIIKDLSIGLADFLISGFHLNSVPFAKQTGVYAYLTVFYSLKLYLVEAMADIKKICNLASDSKLLLDDYNSLLVKKIDPASADSLMQIYMKPFYDFGCGILGTTEDVSLTDDEVRSALLNSVLLINKDRIYPAEMVPGIKILYELFQMLREILPETFDDDEFDSQFACYNSIIRGIQLLGGHACSPQ